MNRFYIPVLSALFVCCSMCAVGQSAYYKDSRAWLEKSEACKPALISRTVLPIRIVKPVPDTNAFQGWRMEEIGPAAIFNSTSFKGLSGVVLDFGEHLTGDCTFSLKLLQGVADGPVRFKFTFAEVPAELTTPFDPYTGGLSRAWLQDEIITLMSVPVEMKFSRRLSFRYLKIELLGSSPGFDFAFDKMEMQARTSVSNAPLPLAETTDSLIRKINQVGLVTLKECMQTVYEDGPKRDQRLWIGDLYLEALANAYSFRQHDLTKRCLYLLAAFANDEGLLHANVFEYPSPRPQYGTFCLDYALLYNVALLEYVKVTGDYITGRELWPVAVRQVDIACRQLTDDGVYDIKKEPRYWLVFDWKDELDRHASMQGLMIFAIRKSYELAELLGKEQEVSEWPGLLKKMTDSARKYFYDKESGVVVSGIDRQVSYLSQVWMILSDVLTSKEAVRSLSVAMDLPDACYPGCPYAYHYLVEALIKSGLYDKARNLLTSYWGGMVRLGADTFWEVYDSSDHTLSPYGFFPVNSYCHAWSCTPVYFINKYPGIFQK